MLFVLEYFDLIFFIGTLTVLILVLIRRRKKLVQEGKSLNFSRNNLGVLANNFGGIVAALFVLFGGLIISLNTIQQRENIMKQYLRNNTINLIHSFHVEHIERLNFLPDDVESSHFQRISQQIKNYSNFSGVQGIFTIKKHNGAYFFGPMSYAPHHSRYSEPGTQFLVDQKDVKTVFEDKISVITTAHVDAPDGFVRCYAPMLTIDKSDVLMVVGVEVSSEEWIYELHKVKIIPIIVSLILLIIILIGFRFVRIRSKQGFFYKDRIHYREGILVFVAGLVITFYASYSSLQEEKQFQYGVFSQIVSSEVESLSGALDLVRHTLKGGAQLFSSSDSVTRNEFNVYMEHILDYPMVNSVGWVRQDAANGFVVAYEIPADSRLLGNGSYSAAEDKLRFGAVLETLYTGFISSTPNYMRKGKSVVDLFLRTTTPDGNTSGFVFLSLDLDVLAQIFSMDNSGQQLFVSSVEMINYRNNGFKSDRRIFDIEGKHKSSVTFNVLEFFYGKTFLISISADEGFSEVYKQNDYQTTFIFGLLISLFFGGLIIIMSNRKIILERQLARQASELKFSEERFRSLFSNMLEGVVFNEMIFDGKGEFVNYRFLEVNSAFQSLLKLEREEVIGKSAIDLFGNVPFYFDKYREVVREQKAVVFETYSAEHDKFLKISAAPWGKNGFATIFTDITLRKTAEEKLKKSEERYRLISENAEDLIWLYDPNKEQFVYVSPSVRRLSGFDYHEIVGKGFDEVLSPESYKEMKFRLPLRIGRFSVGDESMRVKRGRADVKSKSNGYVPIEVVTTLLPDEENLVSLVLGVGRDISDRLHAEEALRKSEEKYRLIVENQNDLIVKIDWEGYFTYVSPSYCRLFGKSENELLNTKFMPLVHPEDQKTTIAQMKKLSEPPYHVTLEQRAMTREGWKWLSWHDNAVLNEDGSIKEIIGVGRDITARKMAEIALRESRELLERQNEEYASLNEEYLSMNEELTSINEDLSQAIERAEESEKLKTAFLQNMSHEIRTPLNAVIGFSEMLGMDYITASDREEFTNIIVNSSRQLLELVNDILTISAIETRQDKVNVAPVNIGNLISELYAVFKAKAKEKDVLMRVYKGVHDEKAVIMTDELKLRQVLINLLGNALKFTDHGVIELGFEAQEDAYYRFFVKDTGLGISKPMQKKIFERFVQEDSTVKGRYGGTGLGLAICKGHVELLGGEIWLESTPGVGSAFYFTLPVMPD